MEKEIIKKEDNKENSLVPQYQFNRVDFNNPVTILNYGQDILQQMELVISDASKNLDRDNIVESDFKSRVDKLSNFSSKLDSIEQQREKKDIGINKIYNKLANFSNKILNKDKDTHLSYTSEYQAYVDNVDELVEIVNKMYEYAKSDFNLFNKFITDIKPYIEILKEVLVFGNIDRKDFEKEVLEIETKYKEDLENSDLKREAISKRQLLDVFEEKLYSIEKSKVTINQVVLEWNMRQINAIKQLTSYQNFLSLDKSLLKLNGTALVGAKKQKEEVQMLQYLIDGVNLSLVEGPKELNETISSVNELTKDGNIKIETIMEVDNFIQAGVELLKQGSIEKKEFIETNSKQLEIISEHFKEFHMGVKESMLLESFQDTYTNKTTTSYVKKK